MPEHHPSLSYLEPQPPLVGQTLYLGGELGPDSRIYCIPGNASKVLMIDPFNDLCLQIGPDLFGKFKWLRGIKASNNIIYGLPCHSDTVLRIDATAAADMKSDGTLACFDFDRKVQITTMSIPYEDFFTNDEERERERKMLWKYHGGSISPVDGCIYCIPQSATRVLKIDPQTDACTFVGPKLEGTYKWYGGLAARDGAIYGVAHNSRSVLRIRPNKDDPNDVLVSLHGDLGSSKHQWHGAGISSDGTIVCIPNNASTVLLIRPCEKGQSEPTLQIIGGPDVVGTGENAGRLDRKYKYLGSVSDENCNVYCLPSGTERVLRINTSTLKVDEIGPSLFESGMERLRQNKWQNGFYSKKDNCAYAIPLASETVLRIDINGDDQGEPVVTTMGLPSPYNGLAKWEGGVIAKNGCMYCMPNNFKKVLKIHPQ